MIRRLFCAVLLVGCMPALATERLGIGYLELTEDPRYAERNDYAQIHLREESRPFSGAQLGLADAQATGGFLGMGFYLQHFRGEGLPALLSKLKEWKEAGTSFVLLDLPGELIAELAAKTRNEPLLLFNISAPQDALRGIHCQPQLLHTLPSRAMLTDAVVQYLVSKGWRELLVLQGLLPGDAAWMSAWRRSAKRFGAKVVADIPLLTIGNYDALVAADSKGEFGRYLPYQTKVARPVVGSSGLMPTGWSGAWKRYGARQVNERFQQRAGRHMQAADWAAWMAMNAIAQSALRTKSVDFQEVSRFLRGSELNLDGSKGPALSFRTWNNQLRQPILLTTHDAVIARAPLEGFLHPLDNLDTLGDDQGDSQCSFQSSGTLPLIRWQARTMAM